VLISLNLTLLVHAAMFVKTGIPNPPFLMPDYNN